MKRSFSALRHGGYHAIPSIAIHSFIVSKNRSISNISYYCCIWDSLTQATQAAKYLLHVAMPCSYPRDSIKTPFCSCMLWAKESYAVLAMVLLRKIGYLRTHKFFTSSRGLLIRRPAWEIWLFAKSPTAEFQISKWQTGWDLQRAIRLKQNQGNQREYPQKQAGKDFNPFEKYYGQFWNILHVSESPMVRSVRQSFNSDNYGHIISLRLSPLLRGCLPR